jgi:hypothetical protein
MMTQRKGKELFVSILTWRRAKWTQVTKTKEMVYLIKDLKANTNYQVRVTATNKQGKIKFPVTIWGGLATFFWQHFHNILIICRIFTTQQASFYQNQRRPSSTTFSTKIRQGNRKQRSISLDRQCQ